jgi:predicted Rossmann fold nucleotide-binding protein DprA/Smf involved in DNA uptake
VKTRLGKDAPSRLLVVGNRRLLRTPSVALLCSADCPGHAILAAHDQAARWRDEGRCVVSGFHSPVEKNCLRILLRGRQPIIVCPARSLERMRLPADLKEPLAQGRLLLLSPFASTDRRVTTALATQRNRLVAALADEIVFAYVKPGGHLDELRQVAAGWKVPCRVLTAWKDP